MKKCNVYVAKFSVEMYYPAIIGKQSKKKLAREAVTMLRSVPARQLQKEITVTRK